MALARRLAHEQSIGVLFTEHSMDVVFAHADRIIVLARGELIAEGPPAAVRGDARVREVYFGGGNDVRCRRRRRTTPMLDVQSLEAWYGQAQVLYGVSLGVGAGECVALVGRNGAGKSTTMKAIMGLMARRRGRVVFRGTDISALPFVPHRPPRPRLGAGGPAHLHRPQRAREPRGRRASRRATARRPGPRTSSTRCSRTSPRCPIGPAAG